MKIDSSTIGISTKRSYQATKATATRFTLTQSRRSLAQGGTALYTSVGNYMPNADKEGKKTNEKSGTASLMSQSVNWQNRFQVSSSKISYRNSSNTLQELQQRCVSFIFQLLFGYEKSKNPFSKWIEENMPENMTNSTETVGTSEVLAAPQTAGTSQAETAVSSIEDTEVKSTVIGKNGKGNDIFAVTGNWRELTYQQISWHKETENTGFSTTGMVKTADGREIPIELDVSMSREFEEYYEESLSLGEFQVCDPLVINFNGNVADVSNQKFYFDIDADGEKDEISQLGTGSGFLALDKNGDGIINDGSELFGAGSGNGFADLAQYDQDGNGWIDENDEIWSKLKIWCKNEKGEDVLYRLADKGVGAICLQNKDTDFTLQNQESGEKQAIIRKTGIFLYENGEAGTVQHLDMVKFNQNA